MSVYKRGSKWCFDFWVGGKRYRGSIPEARVKAQAERAENAIRDQVYEGRYGKKKAAAPLLRDFVTNTFLTWSRANKRTWREDVYRSQSILAFFGKYRLDEISSAQIEKFKMKRQQTPTKNGSERRPATVNRELENLSRMFTLAIDMGIVQINPCQKVQSLSEDNERNRYLSEAEERRLLDVLHGRRKHLRSIVLIDLQTGLRKRELLSLRWQNVDFERDVIHVMNSRRERTKSGRSRSVPLTSIAREELLALHKVSGWSEYVFVNSA
jgi:integrase